VSNVIVAPRSSPINVAVSRPSSVVVGVGSAASVDVAIPVGRPGPMGTLNVVELTEADYASLDPKVPNTIYVIT
jgi:hypothetical protein